ncbi:MAG: bifunctional proline dehydrogenase/L-glutamate gamma-semialdehyde dehydrogenase [Myxococcales bacterium]|nr:bifunctional proline dehydrogenase/L-glutamate gamma-semialdehyde dehydrogenase [Myxococcales bacterium]
MGDRVSAEQFIERARALLDAVAGRALDDKELTRSSVGLAELLLAAALADRRPQEARQMAQLSRMMDDEAGQRFTTLLTDRVYRSAEPARVVDAARNLIRKLGIPGYLPGLARFQMKTLLHAGPFAPQRATEGLLARLRSESAQVVLAAEEAPLSAHLAARRSQGVRVNLNYLGEAVLGEREAADRLNHYRRLLERPDVESISVKVSSVFSQLDLLAWEPTLERLVERLGGLYRLALAHPYVRSDGSQQPKLVNLDMEAYHDLQLTLEAFRRTLEQPDLLPLTAGLALQAYLPDSAPLQRELTEWAQGRRERGGAPIRVRIVKGANLLTETADASVHGWAPPIFASKAEVDASFKKMVEYGCQPEHARAVQLGVASHNLFDLAFAMVLRACHGSEAEVSFELLEGMSNHVQRVVQAVAGETLVYAPVVSADSMQTAIAYLMRRLDENTAPENFLHNSFQMQPGDARFRTEQARFERAVAERSRVSEMPHRQQDRGREETQGASAEPDAFANASDTDFSLAANRAWIGVHLEAAAALREETVASVIAGQRCDRPEAGRQLHDGFDPSRPQALPYRVVLAGAEDIQRALASAVDASKRWAQRPAEQRAALLAAVAQGLGKHRGRLLAAMTLDAGKRVQQGDPEVSEAIDFARYYAHSFLELQHDPEFETTPKGVTLVTPPWNFPLAIPAGGTLAALMAGNAVILKPALETALVAERLAEVCWEAGIPKDALQLLLCDDEQGSALIEDARVAQVVLTGASDTARLFHRLRPGLDLSAETGGKNALIVSAFADRDAAIQDAVASAFGHAGQKCSACSLLICEAEVYDDAGFMQTLADAAASLPVGPAWDPRSVVTPLIHPPRDPLLRALTTLEPGERWLLQPRPDADNPRLWSPGIKLDVREGSFTHREELFGPLLGVMRADDLDHALRLANGTPYGLTAGLHSLDEREQQRFIARMRAGNLYINRHITGAIVRRQPFGGLKASCFGAGAKAGGPNYALQLSRVTAGVDPEASAAPEPRAAGLLTALRDQLERSERERLSLAACSYGRAMAQHFACDHDPSAVVGERNIFRYLPAHPMLLRAGPGASRLELLLSCVAARSAGVDFDLSVTPTAATELPSAGLDTIELQIEDAATCAARLSGYTRVRILGEPEPALLTAAEAASIHVAAEPVLLAGRVELLHYLHEQSISHRFHRYGNLAPEGLLPALRHPGPGADAVAGFGHAGDGPAHAHRDKRPAD